MPQFLDVVLRDALGVRQHHRHVLRYTHLLRQHKAQQHMQVAINNVLSYPRAVRRICKSIELLIRKLPFKHLMHDKILPSPPPPCYLVDVQVGVRADDSAATEVHSLPRQVAPEPPLLALEALHKAPEEKRCEQGVVVSGIVTCGVTWDSRLKRQQVG